MFKIILWYATLILAICLLIAAFFQGSLYLTLAAFALAIGLKQTNKHIPLPKVYRDKGVRNDLFEGKARR